MNASEGAGNDCRRQKFVEEKTFPRTVRETHVHLRKRCQLGHQDPHRRSDRGRHLSRSNHQEEDRENVDTLNMIVAVV